ncbi:MAG: putative baseplate assembly protein [Anaerolineales bacterium]|nr:MAG: putative baseplate assembly protein [Anaerolineales bacterium]
MSLPAPNLDDLRFQRDLVDEARRRIIRYCPEWTDYNLSDPGITLIELFAWMTELLVYRLNRVPEKTYIKFMELLGIQLQPASSARTELTFYLSAPFPLGPEDETVAIVPRGLEVATLPTEEEEEVIFTTDQRLVIRPPRLTQLRREADFHRNYLSRLGVETFYAFDQEQPKQGDTFYLGFEAEQDLSGHILQLSFECQRTQAVGIRREDPPWVWECSIGDGRWQEVPPSTRRGERDTTGGLNNPTGRLILYLPLSMKSDRVYGRDAFWVRCRFEQRRPEQGRYSESPRIVELTAHALGAATRATHAVIVREEVLGRSNGDPGQGFHLQHAPILDLLPGETLEVEEVRDDELVFIPWQRVPDFANSDHYDRHFSLDTATGQVGFGPAIRQPDGSVCQYGRVPESGRRIRFSQYRHGGGVAGNVPEGRIQALKSAVPYVDRAINLRRAEGGRDRESLDEAKSRVARELRTQQRAVTAEDYENLAKKASRAVARARCLTPKGGDGALPPGMLDLLLVPAALDALQVGDLSKLQVDEPLQHMVVTYLDRYRLISTTLNVREPEYLGIKVQAEIVVNEYSQPEAVQARVRDSLRNFISPLAMDEGDHTPGLEPDWEGWPFGRDLYVAELYSLIQAVPGVKHVLEVQVSQREVIPSRESLPGELQAGQEGPTQPELSPVKGRMLRVPDNTLLCSLDHEIEIAEL